jgi:TolB protein
MAAMTMKLTVRLCLAAACLGLCLPAALSAQGMRMGMGLATQLTYSFNMDGSFAPDGSRLVYISIIEGREQLFVMNADGSGQRQITRDDADHEDPAWAPDGSRIAFVLVRDGHKVIHLVNPDGSGLEAVTPATQSAIHPSWSPDSRRILYCTDDDLRPPVKNESEIYAVDLATRRIATLVSGGVNTFPVLSPDGRRLAFRRMVGEANSEVFVADADGGHPRNLTNHPAFDGWPSWSPDGRRIAFASNRGSSYQIWVMDAGGGHPQLVANTEGRGTVPRWTPDGRRILFTNCVSVDFGRACEMMLADVDAAP